MIYILDASAAVELILNRPGAGSIRNYIQTGNKIISSDLFKAEVTNVFWKYARANLITKNDAVSFINFSFDLVDEYYDIAPFSIESLSEALRLNHSTYDMLYFTLAKRTGGALLSLDKKLNKLAVQEGIEAPIIQ